MKIVTSAMFFVKIATSAKTSFVKIVNVLQVRNDMVNTHILYGNKNTIYYTFPDLEDILNVHNIAVAQHDAMHERHDITAEDWELEGPAYVECDSHPSWHKAHKLFNNYWL